MMKHYIKLACFVGGALFGSAGIRLLTSRDAKKAYTYMTAKDMNEARAAKEAAQAAEAEVPGEDA